MRLGEAGRGSGVGARVCAGVCEVVGDGNGDGEGGSDDDMINECIIVRVVLSFLCFASWGT